MGGRGTRTRTLHHPRPHSLWVVEEAETVDAWDGGGVETGAGGGDVQRVSISVGRFPPPNRRFVECTEQDIWVSEVGELLREYQRLVEAVRSTGGFQE